MKVEKLAELLVAKNKTVSVAEACTCGLLGYMLSTVPGSSRYFPGGVVAYTGGLKERILAVPDSTYETFGSVSKEMAMAMANGVRELTGTDYALSTTGVAGPAQGSSHYPVGTFFVGISIKDGGSTAKEIHVPGDREATKRGAAQAALELLGQHLEGSGESL